MQASSPDKYNIALREADVWVRKCRFAKARDSFLHAASLRPPNAEVLRALGGCCYECNEIDEALAHTQASLALDPENAKSQLQAGIIHLLRGDARQGWNGFAFRKNIIPLPMPSPPPVPEWNGEPLNGKGIVLIREQGYGDIIQCVRYAKKIRASGGTVYLDVPPPLRRLFSQQPDFGFTLQTGQPAQISTYAYFMDLPYRLGENILQPTPQDPYIRLQTSLAGNELIHEAEKPKKIGLAWSGSASNARDKMRSIGLEKMKPVVGLGGYRFYSLQTGDKAKDVADAGLAHLIDQSQQINDFVDLAEAINKVDLVLSVDTAVAHLAGAMGKSTWLLVSSPADWRWGTAGSRSGWYSSVRLFRQPTPGDWATPIREVAAALA